METRTEESIDRIESSGRARTSVGGALLAAGSLLLVGGLALHPPPSPDPTEFMATIASSPTRWMVAHWATAIGLSAFAIAGLIMLTAGSSIVRNRWTTIAWGALTVSALWITTAALAEATVIARAAAAGDVATFEAWQTFTDAHVTAFVVFALAVAVIAVDEARSAGETTFARASWVGAAAGVSAVAGFALGFWLGVALGGLIWLVSAIVMTLWTLWFGATLARSAEIAPAAPEEPEPGRPKTVP